MAQQGTRRDTVQGTTEEVALQIEKAEERRALFLGDARFVEAQLHERLRIRGLQSVQGNAARIEPVFQGTRQLRAERGLPQVLVHAHHHMHRRQRGQGQRHLRECDTRFRIAIKGVHVISEQDHGFP